jgi:hypothetical protein
VGVGRACRLWAVGLVGTTVVLAGAGPSALAAAPLPTGDQVAAAFYRERAGTFGANPGAKIVETGSFSTAPAGGDTVAFTWGKRPPPGYTPATATVLAQLAQGKVVAYFAVIRAHGVRTLRIVMAGGHVYTATTGCWAKSNAGASPFGTGTSFLFNDGGAHFSPLAQTGSSTVTKFTYTWAPGAQATETSAFGGGARTQVRVTVAVAGKSPFTIHKTLIPLLSAPKLPIPTPPAPSVPKPLCP